MLQFFIRQKILIKNLGFNFFPQKYRMQLNKIIWIQILYKKDKFPFYQDTISPSSVFIVVCVLSLQIILIKTRRIGNHASRIWFKNNGDLYNLIFLHFRVCSSKNALCRSWLNLSKSFKWDSKRNLRSAGWSFWNSWIFFFRISPKGANPALNLVTPQSWKNEKC